MLTHSVLYYFCLHCCSIDSKSMQHLIGETGASCNLSTNFNIVLRLVVRLKEVWYQSDRLYLTHISRPK